jgi:glycosyltransferase involved in cell wall biosynthesis
LSGVVASLAGAKPLLVTIMGSELYMNNTLRRVMVFFIRHVWRKVLVQSEQMKAIAGGDHTVVLPNGVDINRFTSVSREEALRKTGYKTGKHIIWVSDPLRPEKNFKLAGDTVALLRDSEIKLEVINGKAYEEIPLYFRAADALLLTSRWEGSPNVVKEALAAGLPVVSVDVGDVKDFLNGVEGCYITESKPEAVADGLKKALSYNKQTNGIDMVKHLDMKIISDRIIDVYNSIIVR